MTTDIDSDPRQPKVVRAGLGWLLIVAAVVVGFAVAGRIGLADNSRAQPLRALAATDHLDGVTNVVLGAENDSPTLAIDEFSSEEVADLSSELTHSDEAGAYEDDFRDEPLPNMDAENRDGREYSDDYELSSLRARPFPDPYHDADTIPIEGLPVYHPDESGEPTYSNSSSLEIVTHGKIGKGQSLGASLSKQGISSSTVHLIASEMRKIFDFRRSRSGDRYRLSQDHDGRVLDFRYSQSQEKSFYLAWEGDQYVVRTEFADLRPQLAKIGGVVESSLYGAILALGERSALASSFVEILAWDIDFARSVHPGDEFQILYERLYRLTANGDDEYVRPGRILAARYVGRTGEHTAVYFEDDNGGGSYFRPDGSSVARAFLVAPLKFSRITSRFTWARRHPILNITRPHPGIDYAAPIGTPVWSVADGVVEYKARAGASGNLIRIRHKGGLTSHYAHLQNFVTSLKVGDRVQQKQIIGYVGSTGLSTGPHVCFRVKRDGRYVDPMRISGPGGLPVEANHMVAFASVRDQLLADLGYGPLSSTDEAL